MPQETTHKRENSQPRGGERPHRARVARPRPEAKPVREWYYYQVHFAGIPGARKIHVDAVRPKLTEKLHDMIRRGQLLMCGGYPMSIGGMWLLKVKSKAEAERLVMDNPVVACNLVTYRLVELQDPLGIVVQEERAAEEKSENPKI